MAKILIVILACCSFAFGLAGCVDFSKIEASHAEAMQKLEERKLRTDDHLVIVAEDSDSRVEYYRAEWINMEVLSDGETNP